MVCALFKRPILLSITISVSTKGYPLHDCSVGTELNAMLMLKKGCVRCYSCSGIPTPAPKIEITERMFNVVVFYLDDFKHSVGDHSEYSETDRDDDPQISDRIYAIAAALIDSFVDIERDEQDLGPKQDVEDKGAVLVFLPGIFEIEMMQRVLMRKSNQAESFVIIALHSSIPRSSQMCVFDQPQMGKRKVILSTNIAESSITVPDIRYVIDFCLTKQLYMDPGTGLSSLQYRWAPKSSLDQRKGRAGRVTGGRCYRLINKGFVTSLSDWTTPEMRRCSLEQLILWCKILNVGEPQTILSLALDPPDLDRLYESTLLLQQVGALVLPTSPDEPFSGGLTFLGQVMGSMPLDVRLTRLVMFGFVFSCFTECIIMAACLSLPAFLEVPYSNKKDKLKSYINRMKTAKGTFSDPIMMLHVFNSWLDVHTTRPNQSKRYCSDNFIQFNRIQEVASLIQDLESCIRRFNIPHEAIGERKISDMDSEYIRRLKLALAGANYPNYFIKDKYAINKETCLRMFGDKSPSDTVMFTGLNLDIRSDYDLEKKFYRDIRDFYREGFDSIKKLSLESSRLYISFENPREAMVCKSVYYALKMKKLGMTLTLNSKITEEEEAVPSCVNIPIKSGCLEVFVTYVVSPSKLYVQLVGSETQSEWRRMEEDLQYAPLERWPSFIPEKSYGIAQFAEDACSRWCRVSVETVHQDQLRVVYLDWGNKAWIKGRELYKIPAEYLRVPFQATECSLENISSVSSQHNADNPGTWDKAAADFLNTCILNKTFTANI